MARAKLTALAVERAHGSGERMMLSDGDGLYLRKQTREGASWTLRYHFAGREHSAHPRSLPRHVACAGAH